MITVDDRPASSRSCSIEKIQVRSPMTCEAAAGHLPPLLRHGPVAPASWSRKAWRSASSPPSRSASRARSSRCGRSTSAASATRGVEEKRHQGQARRHRQVRRHQRSSSTTQGKQIALSRNGEIQILDPKGRELEKYEVPDGAELLVDDGEKVTPRHDALRVGPAQHADPRRGRRQGPLRGHRRGRNGADRDATRRGHTAAVDHRAQGRPAPADHHRGRPTARSSTSTTCPSKADIEVARRPEDHRRHAARQDRRARSAGTQDITGGLPRVTEIFEARKPKDPAVIAEIAGTRRAARREAPRQADDHRHATRAGIETRAPRPAGKDLRVHAGDYVEAGDPLVRRPARPARHPADHGRGGGAAVPAPRGAERLPLASAWRSTTSTSRSSSPRCSAR